MVKDAIFLKNRHFIIQERFNKLIYGIITIIKYGIWKSAKYLWTGSKLKRFFYRIFELMLATLIQRCNKIISFFIHYENTPIQNIETFTSKNLKIFRYKNSDIFHMSTQNIDCGYSLEPPRRGGSNEYPQSMFLSRNKKIIYTPLNPSFTIWRWGLRGSI